MNTFMMNGVEFKSATALKNAVREQVAEMFAEFCKERFGEDNVSVIGSNEIAVAFAVPTDKDGFATSEVCFSVKPTVKDFIDRVMPSTGKTVEAFDRLAEAENFAIETADKVERKAKEKAEREAKKARDKAEREAKKNAKKSANAD